MADFLMNISDEEFQLMRRLIYERFGINLTDQKRSLLVGRLQKLIRNSGFTTFAQYYEHVVRDPTEKALGELVDRISTNHTYFNREKDHFDFFFNTALPETISRLEKQSRNDLRVWCAGCSSGEEAYMLLMLMLEFLGNRYRNWDAGLLATDISSQALSRAIQGVYSADQVGSIPQAFVGKYFRQRDSNFWVVRDEIKKEITFRRFNLMNSTFPFKKPFQIIFCRNVMIYFDRPTRDALVTKFHSHTEPQGYLFIGHSETLGRGQSQYSYIKPALYQKIT